ncbi:AAA family ATPase [Actinoplanes sp. NPDC049599]|uniref:AAA family ATPase n=1 Tax=Actinoplanes sp. NPDC049599 TaxID=3363903 RepID=UPI0037B11EBD
MGSRGAPVIVITGAMAAGKSTVAQGLAERLPRAAHVRGDVFRRMIVSGREEVTPAAAAGATAQLWLRYRLAAAAADGYARAGFTAVLQDVVLGPDLTRYLDLLTARPRFAVVLAPPPDVLAERDRRRGKRGYGAWTAQALDASLRSGTPRRGLWLDTGSQTPDETITEVLARLPEARWDRDG